MNFARLFFVVTTATLAAAQTCDPSQPQSLDGTCNNLGEGRTRDGAAFERFEFLTGQHYNRGEDEALRFILSEELPRKEPNTYAIEPPEGAFLSSVACSPTGSGGRPRCTRVGVVDEYVGVGPNFDANPRLMSQAFHSVDVPVSDDGTEHKATLQPGVSRIVPFFGQFLAHDVFGDLEKDEFFELVGITGIPNLNDPNNPIRQTGIELEASDILAETAPLFVGTDFDTHVSMIGGPTAEAVYDENGEVEEIEIANTRTVWIDLDAIYGQDEVVNDHLRDRAGGEGKLRLVTYEFEASRYNPSAFSVSGLPPPVSGLPDDRMLRFSGGIRDFVPTFADFRNGENIAIGTVHTAFIRYHNYLVDTVCLPKLEAGELDTSYGSTDENLFQCARRFNIAVFQKISYEDFIPILTGSQLPEYEGYDAEVDSRLSVEANVAYRIHPAVPRNIPVANSDGSRDLRVDLDAIRGIPQFGDPEPGNIGFSGVAFDMFPIGTLPFILGQAGHITADSGLENDPFQQILHGLLFSQCNAFNEEVDGILRGIPALAGIDVPSFTLKRLQQFGVRQYLDIAERVLPAAEGGIDSIYGRNGCPARAARENKDDTHEIGLTMVFSPYGEEFVSEERSAVQGSSSLCLSAEFSRYPEIDNPTVIPEGLDPMGTFSVEFANAETLDFDFQFNIDGLPSNCVDCGLHIHTGTTCATHPQVLGHYYTTDGSLESDPWSDVLYTSDGRGNGRGRFLNFNSGFNYAEHINHAVVVHGVDGIRIGCGVLEPVPCAQIEDVDASTNRITVPPLPISDAGVATTASDDDEEDPLACFINLTGGNEATAEKLREGLRRSGVAARVDNIPLWTGIQYEPKAADGAAMLGRLGAHFVQDQMLRLRDGDRFHYENVLSRSDIENYVASVTFSDVLRAAYGVTNIQDDAFHTPNDDRFIPGP